MPFLRKNVSTKVAKAYTFVTEVIKNTVEMARSIAEVISMRASAIPTWMKRIQKTLASSDVMRSMTSEDTKEQKAAVGGKKSPARAGTKEIVNRLAVSSGNSVGVAFT